MKPENPYKDCEQYSRMQGWDEGYEACANQPISEQEGWQTDEPSEEEEGPFLLDLGDHNHRVADIYVPDTPYREAHFKDTSHIGRLMCPYILSRYVKRWKRL